MRDDRPLLGYTVGVTAVRHAWEFGTALEHRGARVVYAPAMRIIPPAEDAALHDATRRCLAEPVEVAVATTPAALRGWLEAADGWELGMALRTALRSAHVVGRGPRVSSAVRRLGLGEAWAPAADSVTETIDYLIRSGVACRRIAVSQHGEPLPDLVDALRCAGAEIVEATVFSWAPPSGRALEELVVGVSEHQIDAVVFTSGSAATSFVRTAEELGRLGEVADALRECVFAACVGPVTAEPLLRAGLPVTIAPSPKLRTLVREITDKVPQHCGRIVVAAGHRIDIRGHLAVVDAVPISLGTDAKRLMTALGRRPGRVVSVVELRSELPGDVDDARIDAAMATLGPFLGDSRIVQCFGGTGYRFASDVDHGGDCRPDGNGR